MLGFSTLPRQKRDVFQQIIKLETTKNVPVERLKILYKTPEIKEVHSLHSRLEYDVNIGRKERVEPNGCVPESHIFSWIAVGK
ncbi:hypothetical protein J4Q44_G00220100 [Coregonus suidteri]|uniref:Uncharacterized protein n=1 Tax=Coregonus suidteri TaxID=861788 RepID=A0AAN8QZ03_9TELE